MAGRVTPKEGCNRGMQFKKTNTHKKPKPQTRRNVPFFLIMASSCILFSCSADPSPKLPPLPDQPSRWLYAIGLSADSNPRFIGKTTNWFITTSTLGPEPVMPRPERISVGHAYHGLTVGAIRCDFMTKDGSYHGERLLWGRWSCRAGRDRFQVENAVQDDGTKRFEFIFISPIDLDQSSSE